MNLLPRVEKSGLAKGRFFWVNRLRERGEQGREETERTCQPNANQLGKRMRSRSGDGAKGEE